MASIIKFGTKLLIHCAAEVWETYPLRRWSLRNFHPTLYSTCDYLLMLGLKLIYVKCKVRWGDAMCCVMRCDVWCDMICDVICDVIMIWYDMICYVMLCYAMTWHDMTWHDMTFWDSEWRLEILNNHQFTLQKWNPTPRSYLFVKRHVLIWHWTKLASGIW